MPACTLPPVPGAHSIELWRIVSTTERNGREGGKGIEARKRVIEITMRYGAMWSTNDVGITGKGTESLRLRYARKSKEREENTRMNYIPSFGYFLRSRGCGCATVV